MARVRAPFACACGRNIVEPFSSSWICRAGQVKERRQWTFRSPRSITHTLHFFLPRFSSSFSFSSLPLFAGNRSTVVITSLVVVVAVTERVSDFHPPYFGSLLDSVFLAGSYLPLCVLMSNLKEYYIWNDFNVQAITG